MGLKMIYRSNFEAFEAWLKTQPCSYKVRSNTIKVAKGFEAGWTLGRLALLESIENKGEKENDKG